MPEILETATPFPDIDAGRLDIMNKLAAMKDRINGLKNQIAKEAVEYKELETFAATLKADDTLKVDVDAALKAVDALHEKITGVDGLKL